MRKKVPTTVYLDPPQDESLRRLSATTRVAVAVYVRMGINMILAAERAAGRLDDEPQPITIRRTP